MGRITLEEFVEENELESEFPEERIEITDDETADLVAEQAEQGVEAAIETLTDYGIAIEHFANIVIAHEEITSKATISQEDFVAYKSKLSFAIESMGGVPATYFPALESASDYRVAVEASEERVKSLAESFTGAMSKVFASLRDNLYYLVQFCDYQGKRLATVRSQLETSTGEKVTLTFPRLMYFCYDEGKPVTSGKEYLSKLQDSVKTLNVLTKEVSAFTRKDLFSRLRNTVFMFGKDTFIKNYNAMTELLNAVSKSTNFSTSGINKVSSYLLGDYQIMLSIPKVAVDKVDYGNYSKLTTLKEQTRQMGMSVNHFVGNRSGTVELKDLDKATAVAILKEIESLIDGYQQFYRLSIKLSHLGAIGVMKDFFSSITSGDIRSNVINTVFMIFVINYRLTFQMSSMILSTAGPVLNIAKGTTKTALKVVERYISNTKK